MALPGSLSEKTSFEEQAERMRRKKLRLQQVREQEKSFASALRLQMRKELDEKKKRILEAQEMDFEREKTAQRQALTELFNSTKGKLYMVHPTGIYS